MQKNLLAKIVSTSTALSFIGATISPYIAHANNLAPLSFDQMYSLAQNGDVEALRASVRRGMNINVMDKYGDTGLCIAARRHDSYTYNSFRAAGANPRHPCTQNIDDYDDFVNSYRTVSVSANTREAYSTMGKETFSFSPNLWWVLGGVALAGGITAVAVSGGGGGGKSSGKKHAEEFNSLGALAVSKTSAKKTTTTSAINNTTVTVTNTNPQISSIDLSSGILHNTEYLKSGILAKKSGIFYNNLSGIVSLDSGTIGMIAVGDGSSVINNGYIAANAYNASVAMVASEKSSAINNAYGVLSSGGDALGIDLSFNGTNNKDDYTLIGMYADTNSTAANNGDIRGTASKAYSSSSSSGGSGSGSGSDSGSGSGSTSGTGNTGSLSEILTPTAFSISYSAVTPSISGKIIGMEAMILNAGSEVKGKEIKIKNGQNGKIYISAGDGGTDTSIKLTAYGMSSFLDDAFLNGSKNINRAEVVTIENAGTINLGYTGVYSSPSSLSLRKGTGGVVGIRADANTTAVNTSTGSIILNFAEYSNTTSVGTSSDISTFASEDLTGNNVGAGMQSVHGASLTNNGKIKIKTTSGNAIKNYGMISVEGTGTNSDLYTNMKQSLNNNGTITIEASNSYGMASFNGGTLNNNTYGRIIMGSANVSSDTQYTNNIALYGSSDGSFVTLNNYGTIDIYSNNSIAIKNDYSGGQTLTNNGTITIHRSATGSSVFGGYYSVAINNGTINYETTSSLSSDSGANAEGSESTVVSDPFEQYNLTVYASIMTTKSDATTSSTTEEIYNNQGKYINVNGSSFTSAMSVETTQGLADNKGTITLNPYDYNTEENSVGMYLGNNTSNFATILNDGSIITESYKSAAMASASTANAAMVNNGSIETNKSYSLGMYAKDKTVILNNGSIDMRKGNSVAIYSLGNNTKISNSGVITIKKNDSSDGKLTNVYGILANGSNSTIDNSGEINIGLYETSSTLDTIRNGIGIVLNDTQSEGAHIMNMSEGKINVENGSGIKVNASSAWVENHGLINVKHGNGIEVSDSGSATVLNYGTITTSDGYGIYVDGRNSAGTITVENHGSITSSQYGIYAIAAGEDAEHKVTIINDGTITAGVAGIFVQSESDKVYLQVNSNGSVEDFRNYELPLKPDEDFEANISVVGNPQPSPYYASYEQPDTDDSGLNGYAAISIVNVGVFSAPTLNFNTPNVQYLLGATGSYVADSLQGTVAVDPSVVVDNNASSYVIENAFVGTDNGLELANNLYMFNSSLQTNELGNLNAVLTMNDMRNMVKNQSLADYLSRNYSLNKAESMFNMLKTTESKSQFDTLIKQKFGTGFIGNLARQDLDVEKVVNTEVNHDILDRFDSQNQNKMNILTYKNTVAAKGDTDGYEDKIIAAYGFHHENIEPNKKLGFGLNAIRTDSRYDDGSSRYNNTLEAFVPVSLKSDQLAVLVKPKAGLSQGRYRRLDTQTKHKADTKNYYIGADILAKQNYTFYDIDFEPSAGFDLTNLYVEDISENNHGLQIGSRNVVSAQSQIGLDVKKKYAINSFNSLELSAGGKYYHEFGNKYRPSVSCEDMDGHFELVSNRLERNYGLLAAKAKYNYRQISLQTSANIPVQSKHKPYYMLNMGYSF